MQIEILDARTLSETDAQAIGALLATVWPKLEKDATFRARQMIEMGEDYTGPEAQFPRALVIRERGKVIATASILPRTIGTTAGDITIAGLARVCTDPEQRGRGLGETIVKAAFEPVDSGAFPFSLFQTSPDVRPFYEKLGCCECDNTVINSLSDDLHASPFWDRVIVRYPCAGDWPEGEIDLRGPGY